MGRDLLSFLLDESAAEMREVHRLQFRNELGVPTWLLLFFGLGLIVFSFWLYRRHRMGAPKKTLLSLLRGFGYVLLLLILVRPYLQVEGLADVKGHLLVILDGTESMTIQDVSAGGQTVSRFDAGKRVMKHLMANHDRLSRHFRPSYYLYREVVDKLSQDNPEELDKKEPGGTQTSLVTAVRQVMKDHRGEPIAAVFFLTDGMHNTSEFFDNVVEELKADNIPFYSMGLGLPEARDISLSHLFSEDVVFIDESAPFLLKIQQTGFSGQEVNIRLFEDNEEKAHKAHVLEAAREQTVQFPYIPHKTGKHRYRFQIDAKPDEMVQKNNESEKIVEVVDAQIRVLLHYGKPDWEYRYLKGAFERDKRVKLTVLMDETDRRVFDQNPKNQLKIFPAEKKEFYDRYDLLIFGQVNAASFSTPQLEMIRDFIGEEGGAVVFIADPTNVPASFKGTAVENLFPVKFQASKGRTLKDELTQPMRDEVLMRLSDDGRQHPLVRLEEDPQENEKIWVNLLPHYWFFRAESLKPAASSLLVERAGSSKGEPLIVHHAYGKGTVLFMAINDTWRWRYQVGETYFRRFWGKVVQFMGLPHLTGSSSLVTLTTDKRAYLTGEKVHITARVLNPDFSPSSLEKVAVEIRALEGSESVSLELNAIPNRQGMYRGEYLARHAGEFNLRYAAGTDNNPLTFAVRHLQTEFRYPEMNKDLLESAAKVTGGQTSAFDASLDVQKFLGTARKTVSKKFEPSLWDTWAALLLSASLFGLEWYFRKRWYLD